MKRLLFLLTALLFLPMQSLYAQDETAIGSFLERHPKVMTFDVLQGEHLQLATDGDTLLMVLDISNPQLLIRFVMQGFSVFVDPTGHHKSRYELIIPSAENIDKESIRPDEERPISDSLPDKPNILPLLEPITAQGVTYAIRHRHQTETHIPFLMQLDTEADHLYYYLLFPLQNVLADKKLRSEWAFCIHASMPRQPAGEEGMMPPPPPMEGGQGGDAMPPEISDWTEFSFDRLNSLNLQP